jgi:alpha-tubulin suppressor-like RCC1 family protein
VKTDGALYCWGYNADGQAGQTIADDTLYVQTPTRIASPGTWNAVDVGGYLDGGTPFSGAMAAGFDSSGALYTWGGGESGQLGNGDSGRASFSPRQVGSEMFVALGGGMALKADGTAWRWGPSGHGGFARSGGGGPAENVRYPTPGQFQTGVKELADAPGAGSFYSDTPRVWVGTDGALWDREDVCPTLDVNYSGWSLCPATTTQVGTDVDWASAAADWKQTCAIKTSGALYCWGLGPIGNGQDGQGSQGHIYDTPQAIAAGTTWKSVSIGELQICGIRTDGSLWCWGSDAWGELGQGVAFTERLSPSRVGSASDWVKVSAGSSVTCGIRQGGALYCWGYHASTGQGETAPDPSVPTATMNGKTFTDVDISATGCAVATDGTLWCWGLGSVGEVAHELPAGENVQWDPVQVGTDADWMTVRQQIGAVCALKKTGALWCWGDRQNGLAGAPTFWRDAPGRVALP